MSSNNDDDIEGMTEQLTHHSGGDSLPFQGYLSTENSTSGNSPQSVHSAQYQYGIDQTTSGVNNQRNSCSCHETSSYGNSSCGSGDGFDGYQRKKQGSHCSSKHTCDNGEHTEKKTSAEGCAHCKHINAKDKSINGVIVQASVETMKITVTRKEEKTCNGSPLQDERLDNSDPSLEHSRGPKRIERQHMVSYDSDTDDTPVSFLPEHSKPAHAQHKECPYQMPGPMVGSGSEEERTSGKNSAKKLSHSPHNR